MNKVDGISGTDAFKPKFTTVTSTGTGAAGMKSFVETAMPTNLSYIEPSEEIQAQSLIDNQFRELTKTPENPAGVTFREHARLTRYFCAVKIYVRPEELKTVTREDGTKGTLYLPDSVRAEDRYQSCAGLVIQLGPQAFKDKDGNPKGSQYKVGDWVVFPRTDIIRIDFCGIPLGIMTDDRAVLVTDEPTYWAQGSLTYKA